MQCHADSQAGAIVPHGAVELSSKGIYEDLVLVEFEDNVREPPHLLPLQRLADIASAPIGALAAREGLLDGLWQVYPWRQGQALGCDDADEENARLW